MVNCESERGYAHWYNGSFHILDQSFAQRKHYVYSQAARSKLSWVYTCPQMFIIIKLKEKGVMQ